MTRSEAFLVCHRHLPELEGYENTLVDRQLFLWLADKIETSDLLNTLYQFTTDVRPLMNCLYEAFAVLSNI